MKSTRRGQRVCAWALAASLVVAAGCEGTGALATRRTETAAAPAPAGTTSPQTPTPLVQKPQVPTPAQQAPPPPQPAQSPQTTPPLQSQPSTSPTSGTSVAFRAPVSVFPGTATVVQGKRPDEIVEIVLPGRLYNPPMKLEPVATRDQANRSTPEQASASDFSALRVGDPEWLKENYTTEDYPSIQRLVEDRNMRKMNQGVFMGHGSKTVVATCMYKDFSLVFVQYDDAKATGQLETYTKVGSSWKRTNALANDETAVFTTYMFRHGEVASVGQ